MDFVPNHTSNKHVWFQNSVKNVPEYADYYVWKNATNQEEMLKNDNAVPIPPNNWVMYKTQFIETMALTFFNFFLVCQGKI